MHLPIHDSFFLLILANLGIFLCWITYLPTQLLTLQILSVFWLMLASFLSLFLLESTRLRCVCFYFPMISRPILFQVLCPLFLFLVLLWETDCNEIVGSVTSKKGFDTHFSFVFWKSDLSYFNILRIKSSDIVRLRNASKWISVPFRTSSRGHEFF